MSVLNQISIILALIFIATNANAAAEGTSVRGGGDPCESRFKLVRDDLRLWIHQGGASTLDLPVFLSSERYALLMLEKIEKTGVRCVAPNDPGYPVAINGTPKTCRFEKRPDGDQIICDYRKFLAASTAEQYVLIHHEYAGIAGVEKPNQDDSHYEISNQIVEFISDGEVPKLMVKPTPENGVAYRAMVLCEYPKISNYTGFGVAVRPDKINSDLKPAVVLPTDLRDYSITLSRFQGAIAMTLKNLATGVSVKAASRYLNSQI